MIFLHLLSYTETKTSQTNYYFNNTDLESTVLHNVLIPLAPIGSDENITAYCIL